MFALVGVAGAAVALMVVAMSIAMPALLLIQSCVTVIMHVVCGRR